MVNAIVQFKGEWAPLSNFFFAARRFEDGVYPTNEHYFQASKTRDAAIRARVRRAKTPGEAKRLGSKSGGMPLREDWEHIKIIVMRHALTIKFAPGTPEAAVLLRTGTAQLIEGNTWNDRFWGVTDDGKGQNWLGWLLMAQRGYLQSLADA